jgi:hypothetical protein
MNQTGDPRGDGTGGSDLPDLMGEFTFRRSDLMPVSLTGSKQLGSKKNTSRILQSFTCSYSTYCSGYVYTRWNGIGLWFTL